jgi:hypothetical protein
LFLVKSKSIKYPLPDEGFGIGGESVLREPEAPYLINQVRDGLPMAEFHAARQMLGLSEERLAALLGMSRATLHRRKKSGHLDRAESDRLVRRSRAWHALCRFPRRVRPSGCSWIRGLSLVFPRRW